jgi:hypothetical protein
MQVKLTRDDKLVMSFRVYNGNILLGFIHILKDINEFRYAISGPVGTHDKAKRLVQEYLAERELLDIEL